MAIGLKKTPTDKTKNEEVEVEDLNDSEDGELKRDPTVNKMVVIGAVVVCAAVLAIFSAMSHKDKEMVSGTDSETTGTGETSGMDNVGTDEQDAVPEVYSDEGSSAVENENGGGNGIYDENGKTIDPNGINPGMKDYEYSTNDTTSATVYSPSDYIKDLNGLDISAIYRAASIEYVTDYVSYETRRALTDDGMELYWLEARYKGKDYRVQVPFYYFKDLGTEGICKVEVEIVNTAEGGKVITYMRVVDDSYVVEED